MAVSLFASSCNDWFDVRPRTQLPEKEMFKTETGFKDALSACYVKMRDSILYGESLSMTDIDILAQLWGLDTPNDRGAVQLQKFNYADDYSKDILKGIYGGLYNTISQANLVKRNLETGGEVIKSPSTRALIEAEVLSVRAFCHLDILRLFGQMPKKPTKIVQLAYAENVSNSAVPYYSYSDFVTKIENDLLKAVELFEKHDPVMKYTFTELENLTETNIEDPYFYYRRNRFNYYAAKATLARLYMYTGANAKANDMAKSIINAKNLKGENYVNLGGNDDFGKKYYSLPSETLMGLGGNRMAERFMRNYKKRENTARLILTKAKLTELFEGRQISSNNRYNHLWGDRVTSQGQSYPYLKKYEQPEKGSVSSSLLLTKYQAIPLLRLSEMYLIAMETESNLGEFNRLYQEYMIARGESVVPFDTIEKGLAEILNEYRREFYSEGQMFFTYKRNATESMLWKTDRKVTEKDYVLPLPSSEYNPNNL